MRAIVLTLGMAAAPAAQQQIIVGPQPMVVGQEQATMLLTGTSIQLQTVAELTTKGKKLKVGDRFNLGVTEAVTLNGVTVIPVGSLAVGEVATIRNKGMFGKSGLIEARLLYVRANNRQIRITGRLDDKGAADGGAATAAAVATYAIGGFFITGTSARVPAGTHVTAYLDEDMPVEFAPGRASTNPMVVPVDQPKPNPSNGE